MMNYLNLYVIKIFSLLFLLNAINASARIDEVLQIANNFIEVKEKNVSINNYILDTQNEIDNFYIFNLNPTGYIIVSAQKNIIPIIAFSFEDSFDLNDLAPQLYQIIDDYRENIYQTVSNNISNASILELWVKYLNNDIQN